MSSQAEAQTNPRLNAPETGTAGQKVPFRQRMWTLFSEEDYEALCREVERANSSELVFYPDWHIIGNEGTHGVLHYSLHGTIHASTSAMQAGGAYAVQFALSDTVEAVADRIADQCRECETQALDDMQDSRDFLETLLTC